MRGLDGVPPCRACLDAGVSAPCCASTTIEEKGREAILSHANLVRHTLSPQSKRRDERRTSRPACGPTACTASPRASGRSVRSPPRCILRTCVARYRCMHTHSHRAPFHLCVLHCALTRALEASQPHTVTHPSRSALCSAGGAAQRTSRAVGACDSAACARARLAGAGRDRDEDVPWDSDPCPCV
jgi:hypothetical protein